MVAPAAADVNRDSVAIDVEERFGGVSDCGLDFSFRSYPESFGSYAGISSPEAWDVITEDCMKCVVLKCPSFWLAAGSEPRCALEELARKVFELHVAGIDGTWDATKSGAEWWVQVRHEGDSKNEAVAFHWDKDEALLDNIGVNVHPAISTVTYLTTSGAPTLVLDCVLGDDILDCTLQKGYLSFPKRGKHIAFDGRLLHGAPRELAKPRHVEKGYTRVSFLVNIWLNYRPLAIEPLPEEGIRKLGLSGCFPGTSARPTGDGPEGVEGDLYPYTSSEIDQFGDMRKFRYDLLVGKKHTLVLPVSIKALDSVTDAREGKGGSPVDCVRLRFANGAEAAVVEQRPMDICLKNINRWDNTTDVLFRENFFFGDQLSLLDTFFNTTNFEIGKVNFEIGKGAKPDVRTSEVSWLLDDHVIKYIEQNVKLVNDQKYRYNLTYIEPIQCSLYRKGGFYAKHEDDDFSNEYNLLRKLSFVVCLSDEDEYEGGDFMIYHSALVGDDKEFKPIKLKRNEAIFFPSYITHEVKPVTKGIRKTLVGWASGPNFY